MYMYCLKHEREFVVLDEQHGHIRLEFLPAQVLFCFGPYAFCPPPELPADWVEHATPPTPEELVQIDRNAMELAFDLELA